MLEYDDPPEFPDRPYFDHVKPETFCRNAYYTSFSNGGGMWLTLSDWQLEKQLEQQNRLVARFPLVNFKASNICVVPELDDLQQGFDTCLYKGLDGYGFYNPYQDVSYIHVSDDFLEHHLHYQKQVFTENGRTACQDDLNHMRKDYTSNISQIVKSDKGGVVYNNTLIALVPAPDHLLYVEYDL